MVTKLWFHKHRICFILTCCFCPLISVQFNHEIIWIFPLPSIFEERNWTFLEYFTHILDISVLKNGHSTSTQKGSVFYVIFRCNFIECDLMPKSWFAYHLYAIKLSCQRPTAISWKMLIRLRWRQTWLEIKRAIAKHRLENSLAGLWRLFSC